MGQLLSCGVLPPFSPASRDGRHPPRSPVPWRPGQEVILIHHGNTSLISYLKETVVGKLIHPFEGNKLGLSGFEMLISPNPQITMAEFKPLVH